MRKMACFILHNLPTIWVQFDAADSHRAVKVDIGESKSVPVKMKFVFENSDLRT